jgi:hypothetical protein
MQMSKLPIVQMLLARAGSRRVQGRQLGVYERQDLPDFIEL